MGVGDIGVGRPDETLASSQGRGKTTSLGDHRGPASAGQKTGAHDGFDELCGRARAALNPRNLSDRADAGGVGSALLSDSGAVYVGVCVETACSMGFCAEQAAAASMITAGEHRVVRMVAVGSDCHVMPPCGRCREFISQLHADNGAAEVLVAEGVVRTLAELLPWDWRAPHPS